MQSSGGLSDAHSFHGKDAILSGPAGGIVGAAARLAERRFQEDHRLRHGRHFHRRRPFRRRLRARARRGSGRRTAAHAHPAHSHRGRGRRLHRELRWRAPARRPRFRRRESRAGVVSSRRPADGHRLQRPARPHPAGLLPVVVWPGRQSAARRRRRAEPVRRRSRRIPARYAAHAATLAAGCIRIAVENMANAIKKISVQRGHDITGYTLTCFGGAAGQHACLVADALGMRSVFIHPLAGVLSAYGIGLADTIVMRQQTAEVPLERRRARTADGALCRAGAARPCAELARPGLCACAVRLERTVLLKYSDTDSTLTLPLEPGSTSRDADSRVPRAVPHALRLPRAGARDRRSTPSV